MCVLKSQTVLGEGCVATVYHAYVLYRGHIDLNALSLLPSTSTSAVYAICNIYVDTHNTCVCVYSDLSAVKFLVGETTKNRFDYNNMYIYGTTCNPIPSTLDPCT